MKEAAIQTAKGTYYQAVGRRKGSSAQVRLYPSKGKREFLLQGYKAKKGDIVVNGIRVAEYFPGLVNQAAYLKPYELTSTTDAFFTSVKVSGGGKQGQLGAVLHGIARALEVADKNNRKLLKPHGLMTRDPRVKERRKAGLAQKARAKKSSPKR